MGWCTTAQFLNWCHPSNGLYLITFSLGGSINWQKAIIGRRTIYLVNLCVKLSRKEGAIGSVRDIEAGHFCLGIGSLDKNYECMQTVSSRGKEFFSKRNKNSNAKRRLCATYNLTFTFGGKIYAFYRVSEVDENNDQSWWLCRVVPKDFFHECLSRIILL